MKSETMQQLNCYCYVLKLRKNLEFLTSINKQLYGAINTSSDIFIYKNVRVQTLCPYEFITYKQFNFLP